MVEVKDKTDELEPLGQYELANRLSYFLWAGMPDDKLRQRAENNDLANPESLKEEARSAGLEIDADGNLREIAAG